MKTVELVKGIRSSVLGFGCAPILGSVEPKKAAYAIHQAIDHGVSHFDLARSYGYGEAEKFFGKVIQGQRQKLIIASKFGIEANWKAKFLTPAKPLIWFIKNRKRLDNRSVENSAAKNNVTVANSLLKRITLSGKNMTVNLEKSLRALNTDYLDYFFIHEPLHELYFLQELIETANNLKDQGKIRAFGLAYMREKEDIHKTYLSDFDVLQFDNSPGTQRYESVVSERGAKSNIIFSPLKGGAKELTPSQKLIKLNTDFPNTVLLCSMFSNNHLKENIALFEN